MTLTELEAMLEVNGLEDHSKQILGIARECVGFESVTSRNMELRLGTSKIGGRPDLPEGIAWPSLDERPLLFLAQTSMAELPQVRGDAMLPRGGLLSFFYDALGQPWGFDPKDAGLWRVLYFSEREPLVRRDLPDEISEEAFPELHWIPRLKYSLPSWDNPEPHSLGLNEAQVEKYDEVRSAIASEGREAQHQMLGWANAIQGPMELECQLVTNGLYCGDSTGYNDRRAKKLAKRADDWRLLLQLDSDDQAEMMWGDVGRLYFWIRKQELAAHSFDSTWAILQCY